jgi:glycosyltransferase involved in cell wall biosynthesis
VGGRSAIAYPAPYAREVGGVSGWQQACEGTPPADDTGRRRLICILHGYLLEGSGSNLWTRSIVDALCRQGLDVHLMAQENHPERYPFITEARRYHENDEVEVFHSRERDGRYAGSCVLHKPQLGDLLPVYVRDEYEEFSRAVPLIEMDTPTIERYLDRNVRTLHRIVREHGITAMHANHTVMMSVVAQRVSEPTGVPFAVMPHGSALEFAVKPDARFRGWGEAAFGAARCVFVHGEEMRRRVLDALPGVAGLEQKFVDLHLGVDTGSFAPVPRQERPGRIAMLQRALAPLPRGRTTLQSRQLHDALRPGLDERGLQRAFDGAQPADQKLPDEALEHGLAAIDWAHEPILLYVGRLISTKGVHGVLIALPLLLRALPDMRCIVVGHGPLREPLEAMLWAMEHGDRDMLSTIVQRGRVLEGSPEGETGGTELTQALRFLEAIEDEGRLDEYWEAAQRYVRRDRVLFTGYLTHSELCHLFPCCDAAVFPSVVREAGPLVFLEAMASGAFPLGTYFGGMKASIDTVAGALPPGGADLMKLDPDPARTVADIVEKVPRAMRERDRHVSALFEVARARYDWEGVAATLARVLREM